MFRDKRLVSVLLLATVVGCTAIPDLGALNSAERRHWKDNAIQQILQRTTNPEEQALELAALRKHPATSEDCEGWLSDHLILMKNGERLNYESTCAKEESRIRDLFFARGSDGTWYYSTFHFCVRMLNLKADEQPESIAQFVHAYSVRAFDVRSDECLKQTWPKN